MKFPLWPIVFLLHSLGVPICVVHVGVFLDTFHSIIKYSLLKLLFTLAHLCEGTPLQPLRLEFLSYTCSTLQLAIFEGMTTEQGESNSAHQRAPLPNHLTTVTSRPCPPPNYNLPR